MYLYAIIDVYSRCIVGWGFNASNAIEVLERAIKAHGALEIINSDKGMPIHQQRVAGGLLIP